MTNYQAMKHVKGWGKEEDDYALFTIQANKKCTREHLKDNVGTLENLDMKQLNVPKKQSK